MKKGEDQRDLQGGNQLLALSDRELIEFLGDQDGQLIGRLNAIPEDTYAKLSPNVTDATEKSSFDQVELATPLHLPARAALPGMGFNVLRKNPSHNDPNTGEIFTPWGSREFGYSSGNSVGDLFQKGAYSIRVRVNRPFWGGIGKITYHTRVELTFDPHHWTPGGVAWWGEVWGWYGTGFGSTLKEWTINIKLS